MSLTKDDLQAIKQIVEESSEDIKIHVAAGFAEVHEKFDKVDGKFEEVYAKIDSVKTELNDKIDQVHTDLSQDIEELSDKVDVRDKMLHNTVKRVDRHHAQIKQLQQKLA